MSTTTPTKFKNPYMDGDKQIDKNSMIFEVSSSDFMFIRLIRPGGSTLTGVNGHMWKKLVDALKQKGIDDNSRESDFEQFVSTSKLVSAREYEHLRIRGLLDGPVGGSVSAASAPDDGGTKTSTCDQHSADETVVSDVQKQGRKQTGKGRKGTTETNVG